MTEAGTPPTIGVEFTSVTVSAIGALLVSEPSLTCTLNEKLPGPCVSVGVQVNAPVVAPMLAPVGAPTSENVSVWAGTSLSVAVAVNVYAASSGIVTLAGTFASTGAEFPSVTVSVIAASAAAVPSLTRTENGKVPGPWSSAGVQVKMPELAPMLAPAGAPTSENVSVCGGWSASVAVAVNV